MNSRINIILIVWALLFAVSFIHTQLTAPTGDGFTRGMNRTMIFLGWQAAALVTAIVAFAVARRPRNELPRRIRIVASLPLVIHGVSLLVIVGMVVYAVAASG